MALGIPSEGFQNSQAYQVPGLPFVLADINSATKIEFPYVTISIKVHAAGGACDVYFAPAAPNSRKFSVPAGTVETFNTRVRDIWIDPASTAHVYASLTTISRSQMVELTGSIWSGIE